MEWICYITAESDGKDITPKLRELKVRNGYATSQSRATKRRHAQAQGAQVKDG
jgi:hypothetical protein